MRTRRGLFSAGALVALLAGACVDLGNLSGDSPSDPGDCPAGQQRLDGRCVDAPAPQPVTPNGTCADGLQDNNKDGTCEASCASAKLGCTPHSRCDDASGKATCVCALGYTREADLCVWHGGPRDPGFQNTPVAWDVAGGVVLDPSAAAPVDPGRVRFPGPVACTSAAFVSQTFPMPAFADAEPFALTISGQQSNLSFFGYGGGMSYLIGGGFGGDVGFDYTPKSRQCLGEGAYGRDVDLRIRTQSDNYCNSGLMTATLDVDRVTIDPAPDCPAPARVVNGDFEGTGGWAVSGMGAEVATAVGTGGGRGGHLSTTTLCQSPSMSGLMSPPLTSLARPALAFSYKGTLSQRMRIEGAPQTTLGEVVGNATFQAARLCVPEWAKGVANPIRFYLEDPGGTCATPNVRDFVFDDLAFVSEPSCPLAANVIDGDFESSTANVTPWILQHDTPYSTGAQIQRNAAGQAHGGAAYATLYTGQICHYGRMTQTITIPQAAGAAGPAVKLWYRQPTHVNGQFTTSPGGTLEVSTTWKQKVVCLDPKRSGQPIPFVVSAYGGSGTCATTYSSERVDVDDVEVTTDATCPVK